jgi:hypothetical protein
LTYCTSHSISGYVVTSCGHPRADAPRRKHKQYGVASGRLVPSISFI